MVSPIEICNNALVRLGANFITSLTEDTVEAIACNQMYDTVRRDLLRNHPWNFAIKRAKLARDVEKPKFFYENQFSLPTDCLRVLKTKNQEDGRFLGLPGGFNGFVTVNNKVDYLPIEQFKIEGRKLLSHDEEVEIVYISDLEDVTVMDAAFREYFSVRLAFVISYKITGSIQMRNDLAAELEMLRRRAKESDGQEGTIERIETSTWLASRGW